MPTLEAPAPSMKLSICIATLNRAQFIGETLESILCQATKDFEVVILDSGSTDDTEAVVSQFARSFPCLRYVRQATNFGIDRDYDRVVEIAHGEFCWLMTDDDLLKPGAIRAILGSLHDDVSLVIANAECRDLTMTTVLQRRFIDFESNRYYAPTEMDRLFVEVGEIFQYIGMVVIRRAIWIKRERGRYYGTLFLYLGVIFQDRLPGRTVLIAEPLIEYRWGNVHTFATKWFETVMINYPTFVWSLPLSDYAKKQVVFSPEPWRSIWELLLWRAWDLYSVTEYRLMLKSRISSKRRAFACFAVALLPGVLANSLVVSYYSLTRRRYRRVWWPELVLHGLRNSRFNLLNWLTFKRKTPYIEH